MRTPIADQRPVLRRGFTLIEVLMVVIIVGLLAGIAIPAFLGQREKANDTTAKSLVRSAASAVETAYADTQNYTDVTIAGVQAIEPNIAFDASVDDAGLNQVALTVTADGYTLTSTSISGTRFTFSKDITATPTVSRTCDSSAACTW